MNQTLVMTVIGLDRPGLVDSLASTVAEYDGNWVESRMAHLAGHFAGILRVQVSPEQAEALQAELIATEGLQVVIHAEEGPVDVVPITGKQVTLELVGQDRPGIVSQISHVLAQRGVNVEQLDTECESAPMTGEQLFRASARLLVPDSVDLDLLRQDLERIGEDLMVDDLRLG